MCSGVADVFGREPQQQQGREYEQEPGSILAVTNLQQAPVCCDGSNGFVSVETARHRATEDVYAVVGEEIVPLQAARGRVSATAVRASHEVPPFDQSAMDGFAVRTSDIIAAPATLPIVARQVAGLKQPFTIPDGPATVRILTGAPMPPGFDAVVKQEQCTRVGGTVTIHTTPEAGQHVRPSGDDVGVDEMLVDGDTFIDARHVALLAAAGVAEVRVRRRVRVAVLSTGSELREPNEVLAPGEIHDSNRFMLMSLLGSEAIELADLGCIRDSQEAIAEAIKVAALSVDVLISTGGVSVGEEDHVAAAVLAAGGSFAPLRASIRPGKPVSIGRCGSTILIALPGNPLSALVTYLWFGRPILQQLMGLKPRLPRSFGAIAGFNEPKQPGRDEFVPVVISGWDEGGRPIVEKRRRSGSARLSALIGADGLARIPGHLSTIRCGDRLNFYSFNCDFSL